jgi:uncharacterized protein (DUF433 family)
VIIFDEWGRDTMKEEYKRLITTDPAVMMGKPVISGTRITVELILEKVSEEETIEQILSEHPQLSKDQILAALEYAVMV